MSAPGVDETTVPAIKSYVDELGTEHVVSYPLDPGTSLPVVDGPDDGSEISVTLTFWRPQRRAIPGELPPGAGNWVDIGRLGHFAKIPGASQTSHCPESSYSAIEQELVPSQGFPPNFPYFLLVDSVDDQAANPGNTFSYTLNLTQCLRGGTLGPGAIFNFSAALSPQSGQPNNIAESAYMFDPQP